MGILSENPFIVTENALESLKECDILIADFHGEATAEKIAFAKYFDGKINCIFGTHTHVQTADEKILPNGTGYITDIGFTGLAQSVIGSNPAFVLERQQKYFTHEQRWKNSGDAIFSAIVATLDTKTKKTKRIKRILKTITL